MPFSFASTLILSCLNSLRCNLVPRVLSFPSPGARDRERETLANPGHVPPRIWEITKHSIEGGAGKFSPLSLICQPLPLQYDMYCHLPDPGRHVTSIFHGLSHSLAPGDGKERTLGTRLTKIIRKPRREWPHRIGLTGVWTFTRSLRSESYWATAKSRSHYLLHISDELPISPTNSSKLMF